MSLVTTRRRRRTTRRLAVGSLAAAVGLGLLASPASAAPSTTLVYSTDGGATWTTSPVVGSGQQVLVRQYFNNDTAAPISGTSLSTSLPTGFTLVAGSTRLCLNPGTTTVTSPTAELACNTDAGQSGPINEAAVWTGGTLTISPTAGVYGQPVGATSGILAAGKKRYVNLHECTYRNSGNAELFTTLVPVSNVGGVFSSGTNTSNTADAALNCGPGTGAYTVDAATSGVANLPTLGQRYLSLQQCSYNAGPPVDAYSNFIDVAGTALDAGTTTTNTAPAGPTCGPGAVGRSFVAVNSGVANLDLLNNRYVNLHDCDYNNTGRVGGIDNYTNLVDIANSGTLFDAGTNASTAPDAALICGPGGPNDYDFFAPNSGLLVLDTLDTARGQGFVQFAMTAPTTATPLTVQQTGSLTCAGNPTTTGTISVAPIVGIPLANPTTLGIAAAALAMVGAATILSGRRRRRTRTA